MTVRSEPTSKRKQSAIVSRATLDRQRGAFERFSAFGLLIISFAGTIAALSGGWTALIADPRPGIIASGILLQGVLTAAEWWYGAGRGVWRYRLALAIDTALTAVGYGPLVLPWLVPYLTGKRLGEAALYVSWAVIVLVSWALAWYPEKQLID